MNNAQAKVLSGVVPKHTLILIPIHNKTRRALILMVLIINLITEKFQFQFQFQISK